VGDVFARFILTYGYGGGLRGGKFTYVQQPYGYEFTLDDVRWTEDLKVSGTIRWHTASGNVVADVTLLEQGTNLGALHFSWNDVAVDASAAVSGTLDGAVVNAQRIAP